jgi:class 3 adenylate cyclase
MATDAGQATPETADKASQATAPRSLGQRLSDLSLRSKLLLILLPLSLLSMGTVAYFGYQNGQRALNEQAVQQLTLLRNNKKTQIENYFSNLRSTLGVFGDNVAVVSALAGLTDGYNQLGRQKLSPERRQKLEDFYNKQYLAGRGFVEAEVPPNLSNYLPRNDRSLELQALFMTENQFPWNQRANLIDHPVSNPYTLAHFTFHPWFRELAARWKFYDIMLVDAESHNIIYSVAKEPDLGTSMVDGPYATTNIGQLYRRILAEHRRGLVRFSDFEIYPASNHLPSIFVATPIYASFKLTGVMIAQVSNEELNRIINGDKSWRDDGLGDTGFASVVGANFLMRNDHRGVVENTEQFIKRMETANVPRQSVQNTERRRSTVLSLKLENESARRALRGETGVLATTDALGEAAVQSYAPLNIPDLSWVIITQKSKAEIDAPQQSFTRTVLAAACVLGLLSTLLGLIAANRFLRPIDALVGGIHALEKGQKDVTVDLKAKDEFGELAQSFNTMSRAIADRDQTIRTKSDAYEALLKRLFPEVVADRMKRGEAGAVDTYTSVSVIYLSAAGFVAQTAEMPGEESSKLLNDLVDRIDGIATTMGVERIKTIGEHYIAACGLSVARLDHAQRTIAFADAVGRELARFSAERNLKLELRAGIAAGQVHAGLVGSAKFVYDMWGVPLNQARRIVHDTSLSEIRITDAVYELVGKPSEFTNKTDVKSKTLGDITTYGRPPRMTEPVEKTSNRAMSKAAE